jgi:Kelch motif/Galactose oxidase, central domain
MKRIYFHLFSLFVLCSLFSCHKNTIPYTQSGDWAVESQLNGPARSEAVSFVINNFAYVGTGWDGLNTRYNDFWKYDPAGNVWTQVSSMPDSTMRSSATAFSVGGLAFVGTGYDGFNYLNDFYQFDPAANTWTRKAQFPGSPRYEAVGFGIGNFGYAGTGFDGANAQKDFYRYDPSSDSWTDVGFSGNKRYGAVTWVYNNQGYLVTGVNSGVMQTDFWVFDPTTEPNWTELRHISNYSSDSYDDGYINIARWNASAFVIGNQAYISTGENGVTYPYTWEYDMTITNGVRNDLWVEKTPFEGPPTTGAVGFSVTPDATNTGGGGFIGTGRSAPGQAGASDFLYQFFPLLTQNPNDN